MQYILAHDLGTSGDKATLNPTAYMSRAEMAVVLTRVLDL